MRDLQQDRHALSAELLITNCDKCGAELTQRKDDTVEAGKARIETFHNQSEPLVEFYTKKGILFEVDGTAAIDDITKAIIEGLGEE